MHGYDVEFDYSSASLYRVHLLISHHTGTLIPTLSDHTIELIAIVKLSVNIQNAREHGAMLRDLSRFLDSEASTSTHAKRFAMGTRGYVGSMLNE